MKFNQSVRNQPPPVAQVATGPATAQPGAQAAGATPSENLVGMLTAAEPQQQKQIIGEHLYRQIFSMHPDLSGKITGMSVLPDAVRIFDQDRVNDHISGMLLEMDNSELLHMLEVPESLKAKVEEAVAVLQDHQIKERAMPNSTGIPVPTET